MPVPVSNLSGVTAIGGSAYSLTLTDTTSPGSFSVTAPATATAGQSFSLTVTSLDSSGHVNPNYAGTVHFTSTDSKASLPPITLSPAPMRDRTPSR